MFWLQPTMNAARMTGQRVVKRPGVPAKGQKRVSVLALHYRELGFIKADDTNKSCSSFIQLSLFDDTSVRVGVKLNMSNHWDLTLISGWEWWWRWKWARLRESSLNLCSCCANQKKQLGAFGFPHSRIKVESFLSCFQFVLDNILHLSHAALLP